MVINTSEKPGACKNSRRLDYNHKVGDKVMLNNKNAYRYETPYKGTFDITQCWTNDMVTLKCGTIKLDIIYIALNHIHLIQNLRIISLKMMYDNVNI